MGMSASLARWRWGTVGSALLLAAAAVVACESSDSGSSGNAPFDSGTFDPDGSSSTFNDGSPNADGSMASNDAAADGGSDGAAPIKYDLYVDAVNGKDTNDGSLAKPFKTLTHLATVAKSGQVVGLLDGSFYEGTTPGTCDGRGVTVPGGLTFRAVHPRLASLANISFGVTSGSLTVIDAMVDGACAGIVSSATDPGATVTLTGVNFINGGHLVLSGTSKTTVTPGTLVGSMIPPIKPGFAPLLFAQLTGSAELVMQGGLLDPMDTNNQCGASIFRLTGATKLTLDGVTVKNIAGNVISAGNTSSVTLANNTLLDHVAYQPGCGSAVILATQPTLTMTSSTIQGTAFAAIGIEPGGATAAQTTTVNITNSKILNGGRYGLAYVVGFGGGGSLALNVTSSQIMGNADEAFHLRPDSPAPITATVTGSTITGNGSGMNFYATAGCALTLSASTITNTGVGLLLDGDAVTAITATAHGNTWKPSLQGADGAGHYTDGTLVTVADGAGPNYSVTMGSTLDL